MKHLFVSYALALILKQKGFDESCFSAYRNEDGEELLLPIGKWFNSDSCGYNSHYCSAPVYQQVVDWFREKHNIHIDNNNNYSLESYWWKNGKGCGFKEKERIKKYAYYINRGDFQTKYYAKQYDALNEAILKALTLI